MFAKVFIISALAAMALAQNPGDRVTGKNPTQLSNGVWGGNADGSFTFIGGGSGSNSTKPKPTTASSSKPAATRPSRLSRRKVAFPGKVTCDSSEGIVNQSDLAQATQDLENFCGAQQAVSGHKFVFAKWDQAAVYMCESGSKTGYCKSPELTSANAQIAAKCANGESGWSSKWYKTYGYKVASDKKICGGVPS